MRDHGGDLDRAEARYGRPDWIDLSTGISPIAYPIPEVPSRAFPALPAAEDMAALEATAAHVYGAGAEAVALAGAQAAIQLVPHLVPPGRAAVLAPSYNEHAAALRAEAWDVADATEPESMAGVDLAVVVNPHKTRTGVTGRTRSLRN